MIFLLFICISPLFSQTAKILSGNSQYSEYSSENHSDQFIHFKIVIKNTGTTTLTGLWLYIYIAGVKEKKWNLPKLDPSQ